ncbi:MAG TPA: two-component regulator propeller domain-containing protein, partial [Chitinophagaceae bacterium]|nr:two-component regulator propeller domain-containing protein [Chitinophagaceae bacterium]
MLAPPPAVRGMFAFLLIFLLPLQTLSQRVKQYIYTHYKTADGLASTIVNNAVQDHKGYIWLSTINGLQRFDGNKFISFRNDRGNRSTIPFDDVTYIYEDKGKNLWVLTADNRVGIFNTSNFRYKEIPIRKNRQFPVYMNKQFIETPDGRLLLHIRTDQVYAYHPQTQEFLPDNKTIPFPKNYQVNHIAQDQSSNKYWLATDSGLAVFNSVTGRLSYHGNNSENESIINVYGKERRLTYVSVDSRRRLLYVQWPRTSDHPVLKSINLKTGNLAQFDLKEQYGYGYNEIKASLEQRNGRTWIYGMPFLAELVDSSNQFLQFVKKEPDTELGIKFNNIYSLYEDRERNVWICTDNGLYVFNPDAHLFDNYRLSRPGQNTPIDTRVQTAIQLTNGSIWLGTINFGLFCYDRDFNPQPVPASIVAHQKDLSIWQIFQHSKNGFVWMFMEGGKIVIYNPANRQSEAFTLPFFDQTLVSQVTEDHDGNLWIGTQGGQIIRWNYQATSRIVKEFYLVQSAERIHKLFADKQGYIWAGTYGRGVLKIDPRSNKIVQQISKGAGKNSLWNSTATDIIQYDDSLLLISTDALNLLNTNTNKIQQISTHNGLPSNTVLSSMKDLNGILWLGMINGLCRANLQKGSYIVYDRNDGILDDNFNLGGAFKLSDGRLIFASEQNFLVFDPSRLKFGGSPFDVHITDFKLSNISLPVDSLMKLPKVNLSYNQNSLVVEFNALNYNKLNKLSYYYQLEGLDDDWIKSDDRHQAIYSYLPPGKYTFNARTKNADGSFSEKIASLAITVYPPFWKAWWFYGSLALVAVVAFYLVDRERAKRQAALQRVRSEIASNLHDDVST